ncbi:hypothetical protein MASR2M48_26740 [Spirochaetota bacterium]
MIGSESSVELPKPDVLTARYKASMDALLAREITGPLATAKAFASQGAQDPLSTSKIGLVYARYGLLDKAEENFKASIRIRPTMQANANLGNVLYLKGDYKGALSAYTASLKLAPMNAISLAGLALCSSEMDDRDATARYLSQLASVDPAIAKRYSYLGDSVQPGGRTNRRHQAWNGRTKHEQAWNHLPKSHASPFHAAPVSPSLFNRGMLGRPPR